MINIVVDVTHGLTEFTQWAITAVITNGLLVIIQILIATDYYDIHRSYFPTVVFSSFM